MKRTISLCLAMVLLMVSVAGADTLTRLLQREQEIVQAINNLKSQRDTLSIQMDEQVGRLKEIRELIQAERVEKDKAMEKEKVEDEAE